MKNTTKKPNVLIIFTDQQRYDTLKAAGYDHMITPNLDKLASEGCLFTHCHSSNPVCMPARHDLLTGLTGKAHGYFSNAGGKSIKDYGLPTLPRIFAENGYRTASIGKMHFRPVREHHGYGEMYTMEEIPVSRAEDDYAMYLEKEGLGEVQNLHGVRPLAYHAAQKAQMDLAHYETTWLENTTKQWLDDNGNEPFLLFLSYIKPHPPWDIPEEYAGLYKNEEFPPVIPKSRTYPNSNEQNEWYGDFDNDEMLRKNREAYFTACTIVDESIGKVLNHLEKLGKKDETLIIFTSDHGEMMGDKGFYSKNLPYESSVRVPMIVRYPQKVNSGTKSDKFVDLLDVLPTCLDVCGLEYPKSQYNLYGKSMVDENALMKSDVVFSSNGFLKADRWVMARNHEYKYIYNYNCGFEEFYDLVNDPNEIENIAESMRTSKVFLSLREKAVEYEAKWGPDGAVKENNFISIEGTKFPPHKNGKYHTWSNIQYQNFAQKDPKERGERLLKEIEIAFSNEEISGVNTLENIMDNAEWSEDFKNKLLNWSDGTANIEKNN